MKSSFHKLFLILIPFAGQAQSSLSEIVDGNCNEYGAECELCSYRDSVETDIEAEIASVRLMLDEAVANESSKCSVLRQNCVSEFIAKNCARVDGYLAEDFGYLVMEYLNMYPQRFFELVLQDSLLENKVVGLISYHLYWEDEPMLVLRELEEKTLNASITESTNDVKLFFLKVSKALLSEIGEE